MPGAAAAELVARQTGLRRSAGSAAQSPLTTG
jgi:hypothetical protein